MCTSCLQAISLFRQRTSASPWALDRGQVADRLLELIEYPDSLQQGAIGLCGPAAFLRAWILNDHLAVVQFAIELFETGRSHVGTWNVAAAAQLMACNHAAIDWGGRTPCPVTEWMMMGAIQDQQNTFRPDFEGQPVNDWTLGMVAGDVKGMLDATGRYALVENRTAAIPQNIFDDNGCDDALLLTPNDYTDVILLIHAGLICADKVDGGAGAFWNNNIFNHYIGLCQPLQQVQDASGGAALRMSYYSWGSVCLDAVFPCQQFEYSYYGAIVARARLPREPLPCTTPATPATPRNLAARIDGAGVGLSWCGGSVNDARYEIERFRASSGLWDGPWGIDAARPSTAAVQWHDKDVPSRGTDTVWYRVRATNRLGNSAWTAPVMLRLPRGDSRLTDPQTQLDILRPPCFVQRVSVLRAPPGLLPSAYGRFGEPAAECQAAQWVYDACWQVDGPRTRRLAIAHDRPLRSDRHAYVFVQFNDFDVPGHARMQDATVHLRLSGRTPGGAALDFEVPLQPAPDHSYFWGHFDPIGYSAAYRLSFEIQGRDAAERYVQRQPDGHQIDSQPQTRALPRLDLPPLFAFADYQPGPDRRHVLQIAVRATSLPADAFEANDSHAQAQDVALQPLAGTGTAVLDLPALNFGQGGDADHFIVSYPSSAADDACRLSEPTTQVLSKCLGLAIRRYPPTLVLNVYTDDPLCVDLTLLRADGLQPTHQLPHTRQLTIYNPTRAHFPDHRFELVLRNSNPALQGPFAYRLNLHYQPALDDWAVDTGAPAYRPRTTLARQMLQRLYQRIDLPRPGEDFRTRYRRDTRLLVQRTAALLLDPAVYADLKTLLPAHSVAEITEDFRTTAALARSFGLQTEAERLLRGAAGKAGQARDRAGQAAALQDLQGLFTEAGRLREAAALGVRLQALKVPH